MKIRAIGTGAPFSRHPLIPTCFAVYTEGSILSIGAPWQFLAKLDALDVNVEAVEMVVLLSSHINHIAGLFEMACMYKGSEKKPFLVAPGNLMNDVRNTLELQLGYPLSESFDIKKTTKVTFEEDYGNETMVFVKHPAGNSHGVLFEEAKILLAGDTAVNEEWLHSYIDCDLIAHPVRDGSQMNSSLSTVTDFESLPVYLQNKIWLHGYKEYGMDAPLPLLKIPPLAWIYDSERRDRVMQKERFIRENSKRVLGQP